jgi:hypothetical protein
MDTTNAATTIRFNMPVCSLQSVEEVILEQTGRHRQLFEKIRGSRGPAAFPEGRGEGRAT